MSCEHIVKSASFLVPESTTSPVPGLGWRLQLFGVGYVILKDNLKWATTSAGASVDLMDDQGQPLSTDDLVARLVVMMGDLKRNMEAPMPIDPTPLISRPPPRRTGIRKSEVERLAAEAHVYRHYDKKK